jgi:adenine-specific DNA methylase
MAHEYPKRLIEVDLPIKRISAHARREKTIHHGHISTLHIWWARRPLAACRAVTCAALWPDPADERCPDGFRKVARLSMQTWANNNLKKVSQESYTRFIGLQKHPERLNDNKELRGALLDFIADFADWDNSTVTAYLDVARVLTQSAHEALGGVAGTRPLVVDPFAGGGSIPVEALRVGAEVFASDLNPIPVLLNQVALEYIPKYGDRLAEGVRKWGAWVKREAEKELGQFYPKEPDGSTAVAYLWARTILCEGPGCGLEVPMIRNMQITRKGRQWHFKIDREENGAIAVSVADGATASDKPTVAGGSVTCPNRDCGYTTPAKAVRTQLSGRNGGADDSRLLAVYIESATGRYFRAANIPDKSAAALAAAKLDRDCLPREEINSIRPYKNTRGLSAVTRIGMKHFPDLYNSRQALAFLTFQRCLLRLAKEKTDDDELQKAVLSVLNCAVSRFIFQNCSLSRWHAGRSTIEGAFGKQALQVVWDFAESNPLSDGPANWSGAIEWVLKVIEANRCLPRAGQVVRSPAQVQVLPDDAADALVTDPPYFAAIPYGDLSNVFYVWERPFFSAVHPELCEDGLVPQEDEIIVTNANSDREGNPKSPKFYQDEMVKALRMARDVVKPEGIGVVVFADSSTSSWEAILGAVIDGGWSITGSWPIDTELQNRTKASKAASLLSSIHLVCRPRETSNAVEDISGIGDWRDVLQELPRRIHEWMPRLSEEGVVGADAIFACLGPALEIFSRYARVEKASGEAVTLREYLEQVWAAVGREALTMVFEGADATGFEPDARLTAMWLWTLKGGSSGDDMPVDEPAEEDGEDEDAVGGKQPKGFELEYDAARKIAQGLGANLEALGSIVEVHGERARLLSVGERTRHLFGKEETEGARPGRKKKIVQMDLFAELANSANGEAAWLEKAAPHVGETTLDRLHQSMILFAAGRAEALKRFLVEEGVGRDARLWRLAQALSALFPAATEEKRWVDGVLARKRGLGF